ncbi:MAG: GNAT family N-acetyltransferase [Clostridia bacterium]|nr:GNAT family N-acetyltransferase [Clostridia bacterium]
MSNKEAVIRPFMEGDRDMVNEFFDQMGPETVFFFNTYDGNRNFALRFWNKEDEEVKNFRYFAATETQEDGSELMVGYVFLTRLHTKMPGFGIAVRDGYKGKSMGRRLTQHAIDYAKAHGCGGITLMTHFANIRGQALYQKMGFEKLGQANCGSEFIYILRFPNN